jgi:hypothetical protein
MTRTLLAALAAALLAAGCSLTIDPEKYAPADCPAGQKACGYKCVSVDDPATGCGGASCDACPAVGANSVPACDGSGSCGYACNPGWGDCLNGSVDGCEARVDSAASCGSCGRSCTAPSTCDPLSFVCTPVGALATGGETMGLAEDTVTGRTFALVKPSTASGQLAFVPDLSVPALSVVSTGLGYVSGLSIYSGDAYFGRSLGQSEIGLVQSLSAPAAPTAFDTIPGLVGPAVDIVTGPSGTLWIPGAGQPARYAPFPAGTPGLEVAVTPVATAVARELGSIRYYLAGQGGSIWATTSPDSVPSYNIPVVTGAGNVGSMAAVDLGIRRLLYWVDVDSGDVWRYEAPPADRKERIFRGSGPASMFIAVDTASGDAYWTNREAGTVMAWKAYAGFPTAAHVVGRSPSPGRIMVNAAFVFWADDAEQLLRAIPK